jgi:hypothetical protein
LAFSCSNSFSRRAWSTCRPPYSLRQTIIRLLRYLRFLTTLRCRLAVGYSRFDLPKQVHHLFRCMPASSPSPALFRPVSMISTGTNQAGKTTIMRDTK